MDGKQYIHPSKTLDNTKMYALTCESFVDGDESSVSGIMAEEGAWDKQAMTEQQTPLMATSELLISKQQIQTVFPPAVVFFSNMM